MFYCQLVTMMVLALTIAIGWTMTIAIGLTMALAMTLALTSVLTMALTMTHNFGNKTCSRSGGMKVLITYMVMALHLAIAALRMVHLVIALRMSLANSFDN